VNYSIKDYIVKYRKIRLRRHDFAFDVTASLSNDLLLVASVDTYVLSDDGVFNILGSKLSNGIIKLVEQAEPRFFIEGVTKELERKI
jgi:hypothetical protein